MYVIIGEGPNGLEIPLVFFNTEEEAQARVDEFPKDAKNPTWLASDFSETQGEFRDEEGNNAELYKRLFKDGRYYPGCGGCYKLKVREVIPGEPMVRWNLD